MDLTKYQVRALYWIAQDLEISSLQVRYKGFDFKPFVKLEKLGLISITDYSFHKIALIEHKGLELVRHLEKLKGKYLINEEKTLELLVKLSKRIEMVQVSGIWSVKDSSLVGGIRVTPIR